MKRSGSEDEGERTHFFFIVWGLLAYSLYCVWHSNYSEKSIPVHNVIMILIVSAAPVKY